MTGIAKLERRSKRINSLVCVGLDPDLSKLPKSFRHQKHPQYEFNKWIIRKTHNLAAAYKLNSAFYEAEGVQGITELKLTCAYLRKYYPGIFMIIDAKRGDIGNTNAGYAGFIFDWLKADGLTLHPYLGKEALEPFLTRKDRVSIILCRTSNPGAGEVQDLTVKGIPLWQFLAQRIGEDWNTNRNVMLVVGATYPRELAQIRSLLPDMTFLVPGVGAQGGEIEAAVRAGRRRDGLGMLISSSRGIIFDADPTTAARKLRDEINRFRK